MRTLLHTQVSDNYETCVRTHATKRGCAESRFAARGLPCPLGRCRRAPPRACMLVSVRARPPTHPPWARGPSEKTYPASSELEGTFS